METLTKIPFELNSAELMNRVQVEKNSTDAQEFENLVEKARKVANPKALFKESFIDEKREDSVIIEGITFTSKTLKMNLDNVERVFPYIATCGTELDEVTLPANDILAEFWWDNIKAVILTYARNHLIDHLKSKYLLEKTATMNPGSGDAEVWPIDQQKPLFDLLDEVTKHIGVELTDTFLMTPNKTVSGILFPTEKDFRTCQVCHRKDCPGRSAPFSKELWESIQR